MLKRGVAPVLSALSEFARDGSGDPEGLVVTVMELLAGRRPQEPSAHSGQHATDVVLEDDDGRLNATCLTVKHLLILMLTMT